MAGGRPWSAEDLAYLRRWWGRRDHRRIAVALGRTPAAVLLKANRVGVQSRRPWTRAQDQLVRERYGRMPTRQLARIVGHSAKSVQDRAQALGLSDPLQRWSIEEEAILEARYQELTARQIGRLVGRSEDQVRRKAHELGLRKRRVLTPDAEELLWEMRDTPGVIEFFHAQFRVGEAAIARLLAQLRARGGPAVEAPRPP